MYAAGANGNATPTRTISVSSGASGLTALADGSLAVTNGGNSVRVYAADANGAATPTRTISGGSTGLNGASGVATLADNSLAVANNSSNSVTVYAPPSTPAAPTNLTATPGDGQATIAFTAPASDGGAAITNYEYSTDNGAPWTARSPAATTSPITITGLTNGTAYPVKLRAVNSVGAGAASAAVNVTPASPAATTTTLTSSLNPSTVGASVTFTATVAAVTGATSVTQLLPGPVGAFNGGGPTGNVEFFDGATSLGTKVLNGGQTSLATSALTQSTHSITAVYRGDANYQTSTSTVLSQVVNATPVTYTVSYNGNGNTSGTAPTDPSSPYASGASVTVLGNTGGLAKTGSTFNGWNTAANGSGTSYAPAATFAINADTTLFAQWGTAPTAIPTLSEWGLILLGLALLAVVVWRQRQGYSQRG